MVYGYHRTSTKEQHLDRGIAEIKKILCRTQYEIRKGLYRSANRKKF